MIATCRYLKVVVTGQRRVLAQPLMSASVLRLFVLKNLPMRVLELGRHIVTHVLLIIDCASFYGERAHRYARWCIPTPSIQGILSSLAHQRIFKEDINDN